MSEQDRDDLQRRFDAQAEELGLSRGEDAPTWADDRTVGKAFATSAIVDVPLESSVTSPLPGNAALAAFAAQSKDAVEAVLQLFEDTSYTEFPDKWDQIAVQPFVVLGEGWMSVVTEGDFAAHLHQGDHPAHPGGTVQILSHRHISPHRAVTIYRVTGSSSSGPGDKSGMAVLFETAAGWRIAIVSRKGEHH